MTALDKAKPCPWGCSSGVWMWDKGVPGKFAVACSSATCAATGPIRDTEDEAVIGWNAAPRRKLPTAFQIAHDEMHPPRP
jgi:hypothetical protein